MTNQKRTHERWKNHGFEMEIDLLCRKPSVGYRDNEGHFGWVSNHRRVVGVRTKPWIIGGQKPSVCGN